MAVDGEETPPCEAPGRGLPTHTVDAGRVAAAGDSKPDGASKQHAARGNPALQPLTATADVHGAIGVNAQTLDSGQPALEPAPVTRSNGTVNGGNE